MNALTTNLLAAMSRSRSRFSLFIIRRTNRRQIQIGLCVCFILSLSGNILVLFYNQHPPGPAVPASASAITSSGDSTRTAAADTITTTTSTTATTTTAAAAADNPPLVLLRGGGVQVAATNDTSGSWYPSEEWVHNCTQDLSSRTEAEGEWDVPHSIALGDCIKFCKCYHRPLPNTSFNKLYHKRACHGGPLSAGNGRFNLSIIDEVHAIQGKNPSLFMIPEPEALVIHLRLGDIVETSKSTVEQMLISGANPGKRPRKFQKGLKSIHEVLDNIHSSKATIVHIVGGSHKKHFWKKSRVYAGCLHRAIQTAGHNVTMRLEGTHPDVDFYYISHASQVVVSAGGYSNLMGKLAEHRGGRIVGRSFGVSW